MQRYSKGLMLRKAYRCRISSEGCAGWSFVFGAGAMRLASRLSALLLEQHHFTWIT